MKLTIHGAYPYVLALVVVGSAGCSESGTGSGQPDAAMADTNPALDGPKPDAPQLDGPSNGVDAKASDGREADAPDVDATSDGGDADARSGPFATRRWVSAAIAGKSVLGRATCGSGEKAVAGGCDCGTDGNITVSRLAEDGREWQCACDRAVAGATAHALCVKRESPLTVAAQPIASSDQAVRAGCPTGTFIVVGGLSCGAGLSNSATRSSPDGNGWTASCDDIGDNATVYAYCAPAPAPLFRVADASFTNDPFVVQCAAGEWTFAGGCACPTGSELNTSAPAANGWKCDCNGVDATATGASSLLCSSR